MKVPVKVTLVSPSGYINPLIPTSFEKIGHHSNNSSNNNNNSNNNSSSNSNNDNNNTSAAAAAALPLPPPPPPPPPRSALLPPLSLLSSFSFPPPSLLGLMAKNRRRAGGRNSRSPSGAFFGGPSTILSEVPGGGVPWAFIAFLLASAFLFAFGLFLVVLSGRKEVVFNTYLLSNWEELDCGVGGVTVVEARKPSGLLLRELTWV